MIKVVLRVAAFYYVKIVLHTLISIYFTIVGGREVYQMGYRHDMSGKSAQARAIVSARDEEEKRRAKEYKKKQETEKQILNPRKNTHSWGH